MRIAAALVALAAATAALGQDRPTEDELFGKPPAESPPAAAQQEPKEPAPRPGEPAAPARPEEAELFGGTGSPNAAPPPAGRLVDRAEAETLRIGGQLYLRAQALWQEDVPPADWALSSPNLLDLWLDARPNDRVRAFVLGRMRYDPTAPVTSGAPSLSAAEQGILGYGTSTGGIAAGVRGPRAVLDQLWVNFDVARRVFVTAGRQHVKWGVGKFWNPTDYLHPVRRDPLAVFDERTGTTMVKVHVPWERRGWNAYGVALLDDAAGVDTPTNRLGRVGVGGRTEVVLGTVELGADALTQDGHRPRFGIDASAGVWDLDVYAEAALRTSRDAPRWREVSPGAPLVTRFGRVDPQGFTPAAVVGGSWSAKYSDEDTVTLGAEYSFDDAGYDSKDVYPFLLAGAPELTGDPSAPLRQRDPTAFRPFYLGRHYAGAFVLLPSPGTWNDTTFTVSVLGNLSDRSFVARLDHALLALTYLRVESFVAASFGARGGEFRLGVDVPLSDVAPGLPPDVTISVPPPVVQLGVALRVSL
ncbi:MULTISPECIES: hypothetical protein [Anaeromyxobacter]|uniref:hypothetical protein n=1 Tax=Anaeromyxobacter TaxID=161492 RepID=UPI001F57EB1D|nr:MULTISPECIES: hypothetical protein [unclassified Anaeromyxobacter]